MKELRRLNRMFEHRGRSRRISEQGKEYPKNIRILDYDLDYLIDTLYEKEEYRIPTVSGALPMVARFTYLGKEMDAILDLHVDFVPNMLGTSRPFEIRITEDSEMEFMDTYTGNYMYFSGSEYNDLERTLREAGLHADYEGLLDVILDSDEVVDAVLSLVRI